MEIASSRKRAIRSWRKKLPPEQIKTRASTFCALNRIPPWLESAGNVFQSQRIPTRLYPSTVDPPLLEL